MPTDTALRWDIFCEVIDNHGDLGVCWRLAADLAARGHQVRLWVDDARALPWMAPGALEGRWARIRVFDWKAATDLPMLHSLPDADVWIEGFGCTLPAPFVAHRFGASPARHRAPPAWINLEYLSAETFVERSHGLPSPILHGPASGHTRHFFFPGFTPRTGGLLREPDLLQRQACFDTTAWRAGRGLPCDEPLWSLFCYEPPALANLLQQLLVQGRREHLLVTHGRAHAAVLHLLQTGMGSSLETGRLHFLPALSQQDYDHLLWACECNFVRGEDSLVRAIWAAKPWVWHIYPQEDGAHHGKLQALMDLGTLPGSWQAFHHHWNSGTPPSPGPLPDATGWAASALRLRGHLATQPDLASRLLAFVAGLRP